MTEYMLGWPLRIFFLNQKLDLTENLVHVKVFKECSKLEKISICLTVLVLFEWLFCRYWCTQILRSHFLPRCIYRVVRAKTPQIWTPNISKYFNFRAHTILHMGNGLSETKIVPETPKDGAIKQKIGKEGKNYK